MRTESDGGPWGNRGLGCFLTAVFVVGWMAVLIRSWLCRKRRPPTLPEDRQEFGYVGDYARATRTPNLPTKLAR